LPSLPASAKRRLTTAIATGSAVISPNAANGNQTAPSTNTYVNFLDLAEFNEVRFSSSNYAFEFDNIALANIGGTGTALPEPAAIGLFGLALAGLVLAARRRSTRWSFRYWRPDGGSSEPPFSFVHTFVGRPPAAPPGAAPCRMRRNIGDGGNKNTTSVFSITSVDGIVRYNCNNFTIMKRITPENVNKS
jgi:hypothetical protein